jgi:MSHA type pilus biogenesis protein MshL
MPLFGIMLLYLLTVGCQKQEPRRASHFRPTEEITLPAFIPQKEKEEASFEIMHLPDVFHQPISCKTSASSSLKEIILEGARFLHLPIRIDPSVDVKCSMRLRHEPFSHLLQTLCQTQGVSCRYINKVLCIEKDAIYTKTYSLPYLNIARKSQNTMRISTDVFSTDSKKENDASNSALSVTSQSNFWQELENALLTMISRDAFSIHKQTGLISVKGTRAIHEQVQRYFKRMRRVLDTQVLIEAKVIEVNLFENYRSGIDWNNVAKDLDLKTDLGRLSSHQLDLRNAVTLTAHTKTFSAILHALDHFGETQTLASPSLRVLNNQSAILKVAKNQVYFRLNYERQYFTSREQNSVVVSSDLHTVPIGLVLLVQPSVDTETGRIMLFLRPTLSRFHESVEDPAVRIMAEANSRGSGGEKPTSPVPVVDTREIDSILCVQSGEMAILGGLMDIRSSKDRSQIPVIGDLPFLGEAFRHKGQSDHVVELVILLRATIVQDR